MISKPIFISHATADKELADRLVILLQTGMGISDEEVFCTSLEGLGIPSGQNFVEFIKEQIQQPKTVILLLTPHYYASEFCLCELGASWSMAHRIFPLLLPPLSCNDVKGVLLGTQILQLHSKKGLNQFQEELIPHLKIKKKAFAIWEKRRDTFLEWLASYIKTYPSPNKIDPNKHKELEKNYLEAKNALLDAEDRITILENNIEKLKMLKNKEQVNTVLEENIEDIEKFEAIVAEASKTMSKFPLQVRKAFFQYFMRDNLDMPLPFCSNTDEILRDIKSVVQKGFLVDGNSGITINENDPLIKTALRALEKVQSFVDNPSTDFSEYYAENYEHELCFQNERFWEEHKIL